MRKDALAGLLAGAVVAALEEALAVVDCSSI
jgi:hypothetical protein